MERHDFSRHELKIEGYYSSAIPAPGPPILNSPISAGENALRALRGEKPLWYPSVGMIGGDYKPFRPSNAFPDLRVAHDFMAGEPRVDWSTYPEVQTGWFGVQWKYVDTAGGCMPVPGTQLIDDINDWEKLPWPNLDEIDWEGSAKANKEYLNGDLPVEFCMPTGYWERLMSILEVSNAAVALIDEDQQDAVLAFFDKLTDFYIDLIRRVNRYYNPDIFLMHDDWGTQNGSFFSYETCERMIVPYFKRFINEVHTHGMRFEHHCCGKAECLVPLMIESGVDLWIPQPMNNVAKLASDWADQDILFGVYLPPVTRETPDEELWEIAENLVGTYGDKPVGFVDYSRNPTLYSYIYELSRKALS